MITLKELSELNSQEKALFFERQLAKARESFPGGSEEVEVAQRNYERALKELDFEQNADQQVLIGR
jgi:hypothetical protein